MESLAYRYSLDQAHGIGLLEFDILKFNYRDRAEAVRGTARAELPGDTAKDI
jgi:hypothetical protein